MKFANDDAAGIRVIGTDGALLVRMTGCMAAGKQVDYGDGSGVRFVLTNKPGIKPMSYDDGSDDGASVVAASWLQVYGHIEEMVSETMRSEAYTYYQHKVLQNTQHACKKLSEEDWHQEVEDVRKLLMYLSSLSGG